MIIGKDRTNQPVEGSEELEQSLGTKLYKHKIELNYTNGEEDFKVNIDLISYSNASFSEEIDNMTVVTMVHMSDTFDCLETTYSQDILLENSIAEDLGDYYLDNFLELSTYTFVSANDTVTKLS